MIRGRRAHGAALATLPTCAHLSPDSQARLHRAGSVPCKPKTLKNECLRHIFLYCATPKGLANTVGAAHTRVRHVAGVQENLLHPYHRALSPPTRKGQGHAVASQALTGFQLRPLRLVLLPHGDGEGSRATKSHFTLDALNRPNTHRRGRWIGFATCPCGLASESGVWGKAPRACFLFLKLLGGCNRSKRSKKCAFLESLLLKTPQIWPIF